jgi:hypothetical protein
MDTRAPLSTGSDRNAEIVLGAAVISMGPRPTTARWWMRCNL